MTAPDREKPVLVTGAAGFIGFHLSLRLLRAGRRVAGLDNLNPYYDVNLKRARLALLREHAGFTIHEISLEDRPAMERPFSGAPFDVVVNLAAQAGVRYSVEDPHSYVQSNLVGFLHILEGARHGGVKHLVYASSSSVYGSNTAMPFSVAQTSTTPFSVYAATKKANELMAHSYAHLYGLPCTGLRFFTVYGPWGRPDMALFKFTRAILAGDPIQVFNHGRMRRDFTYIDDVVEGVTRVLDHPPGPDPAFDPKNPDPGTSAAPFRVYNIGNNRPTNLMEFIKAIEDCLGMEAKKEFLPLQPGDVPETYADVSALERFGFKPQTTVREGIKRFVDWYREYHKL